MNWNGNLSKGEMMENLPANEPNDWTDEEVRLIVQDYFEMFQKHLAGIQYSKTLHRRELMPKLNGRNDASLEFKHRNISKVMDMLGFRYLPGYVPARNKQNRIIDFVESYLNANLALKETLRVGFPSIQGDEQGKVIEYAKLISTKPKRAKPSAVAKERTHPYGRARKVDWAEVEEINRRIGERGEEIVLGFERWRLSEGGRPDLAEKVFWASKEEGDGLGYDIRSFDLEGNQLYIEVKCTTQGPNTPIYFSENERQFALGHRDNFALYRVYHLDKNPQIFIKKGAFEDFLDAEPALYQGRFWAAE